MQPGSTSETRGDHGITVDDESQKSINVQNLSQQHFTLTWKQQTVEIPLIIYNRMGELILVLDSCCHLSQLLHFSPKILAMGHSHFTHL